MTGEPMRVLIAEDDAISRRVLEATLRRWNYDVIVTNDGAEAAAAIDAPDVPHLLVLDWMMPHHDGTDLATRVRQRPDADAFYIVLLTAKTQKDDIVAGLLAGADDYITKPFHPEELRARVRNGARIVRLREKLARRVTELEAALTEVKQLSGLLPICAYCKRVREGDSYWQAVEAYFSRRTETEFSHAVCPDCFERVVKPQMERHGEE